MKTVYSLNGNRHDGIAGLPPHPHPDSVIILDDTSQHKPARPRRPRALPLGLAIVYEDRDVLVVHKPAGLLSMGSERERERTAYFVMMDYVRKGNPKSHNRVFIVHRLDRETSGLLLLAKSEQAKLKLQDDWDTSEKIYLAVAYGRVPRRGSFTSYLAENVAQMVYSTDDKTRGKFAQTDYRVLKATPNLSLLEVKLRTGRKNQIRVHLSENGTPIVGDRKYGRKGGTQKRLALHAYSLTFNHPHSGKPITITAPPPPLFEQLVGKFDLPGTRRDATTELPPPPGD
jgi:tRNA pseudouridine32 synthase/23S rRNA pseudouridine746 synthase/23S rRNA pseudouridine1911/1915/1917 synthase